ncbi:MAG: glutamine cyclotransferase, partial [Bacteroidetes bacterium]|nr:glutamine cyclotransferase [Bacteroidota bacterium]
MKLSTLILFILLIAGCKSEMPKSTNESVQKYGRTNKSVTVEVPKFDGSNAFRYLETQVSFGPRVPNTDPHKQCLDYLRIELSKYAD